MLFSGTGSILVSAAAWGAHVLGTDIDIRVIRDGKRDKQGKHCNVYTNFEDYGLPDPVGLLRTDTAHPPWRPGIEAVADVILCDPPYGVRAGGRKVTAKSHSGEPLYSRCELACCSDCCCTVSRVCCTCMGRRFEKTSHAECPGVGTQKESAGILNTILLRIETDHMAPHVLP